MLGCRLIILYRPNRREGRIGLQVKAKGLAREGQAEQEPQMQPRQQPSPEVPKAIIFFNKAKVLNTMLEAMEACTADLSQAVTMEQPVPRVIDCIDWTQAHRCCSWGQVGNGRYVRVCIDYIGQGFGMGRGYGWD